MNCGEKGKQAAWSWIEKRYQWYSSHLSTKSNLNHAILRWSDAFCVHFFFQLFFLLCSKSHRSFCLENPFSWKYAQMFLFSILNTSHSSLFYIRWFHVKPLLFINTECWSYALLFEMLIQNNTTITPIKTTSVPCINTSWSWRVDCALLSFIVDHNVSSCAHCTK